MTKEKEIRMWMEKARTTHDTGESLEYYRKAADLGDPEAKRMVDEYIRILELML